MTARFYLPCQDPIWMQKIKPKISEILDEIEKYEESDRLIVLSLTIMEILRESGLSNVMQLGVLEVIKAWIHEQARLIAHEMVSQMLRQGGAE